MTSKKMIDISDLINGVVEKSNLLSSHFRKQGEGAAADYLIQSVTTIFTYLFEVMYGWSQEQSMVEVPVEAQLSSVKAPDPTISNTSRSMNSMAQEPPRASDRTTSWAAITAKAPTGLHSKLIKFGPQDGIKRQALGHQSLFQDSNDNRVIWIFGWSADRPLRQVTEAINEIGAIYSMTHDRESEAVCLIFQYSAAAKTLIDQNAAHENECGISVFGESTKLVQGEPFPVNDDIRRMGEPRIERRRLTFARKQLFIHSGSQAQFRADIESLVGIRNIEVVWFFNIGNVTVITTSSPLARLVYEHFRKLSRDRSSPYHEVAVAYSYDPCEKPLKLTTQIDPTYTPGHRRHASGASARAQSPSKTRSHRGSISSMSGFAGSSFTRRYHTQASPQQPERCSTKTISPPSAAEGWQVVEKKKPSQQIAPKDHELQY